MAKSLNRDKLWSFVCFPRSLLITYLLTLSLEKYSVVLEKVLNFGSKNLYEPCRVSVRLTLESHYLLDSNIVLEKKKRLLQLELRHLFIYLFIYSLIHLICFVCLFICLFVCFIFLPAHSPILRVSF